MNRGMPPETPLLTSAEVAKILRVTPMTVSRWSKDGTLQPIRLTKGTVRFRSEDIDRLLEDGAQS